MNELVRTTEADWQTFLRAIAEKAYTQKHYRYKFGLEVALDKTKTLRFGSQLAGRTMGGLIFWGSSFTGNRTGKGNRG